MNLRQLGRLPTIAWLVLWWHSVAQWSGVVHGQQDYCDNAEALSRTLLDNYQDFCPVDRSGCGDISCPLDCLYGADSATTTCAEGCIYTFGNYKVSRTFTGSYGTSFAFNTIIPIMFVGFSHTFTEGAEGEFSYFYEATINDDLTVSPVFGGTCTFEFNGVECECGQVYCDDSQTDVKTKFDCSAVEGGAVINFCDGTPNGTGDNLSLLEILYATPLSDCDNGESPSASDILSDVPSLSPNTAPDDGTLTERGSSANTRTAQLPFALLAVMALLT